MKLDGIKSNDITSEPKQLIWSPVDNVIIGFFKRYKTVWYVLFFLLFVASIAMNALSYFVFHERITKLETQTAQTNEVLANFAKGELPVECLNLQGTECPDKQFRKIIPYLLDVARRVEEKMLKENAVIPEITP